MSEKLTVVEISECFPNNYKPVTGEFILQHVRALSKLCRVITIVPVRYVPSKELLSLNLFKLLSNLENWYSSLRNTKNYTEDDLKVIYSGYFSLPRPYFESVDSSLINFFFYDKLKKILADVHPDVICCHWLKPWSEPSAKLAADLNVPFVIDHHEDLPTLKNSFPDNYKVFLSSFEKASRIIVHSTVNKNDLLKEELDLPEVSLNYLGQNFTPSDDLKVFNSDKLKLVCVSHLYERRKNIDVLIKAMFLVNSEMHFELTIVGDGNLRNEYIKLADSLNLKNIIHFAGSKSQKEIENKLEESDIFILPSYPEAFGIVFIEALAKGLPVITCEGNGGGEELKQLGYDGVLVKPDSPEELAKAVLNLSRDRSKMSAMSEQGKKLVNNYFTWEKNAHSSYDILNEVIKEHQLKIQ